MDFNKIRGFVLNGFSLDFIAELKTGKSLGSLKEIKTVAEVI